jgi:heat-inducible transcriptional repressor
VFRWRIASGSVPVFCQGWKTVMEIILDQRAETILRQIVGYYIESAEPVGSRMLTKLVEFKISAATIRNIMADLTELGLIVQPHVSAGRIPTDLGYRYYINHLLLQPDQASGGQDKVSGPVRMDGQVQRLEDILLQISDDLSKATNCTSIVISPQPAFSKLKTIELIRLNARQLLAVLVTQIGMVHNKILSVRECPDQVMLDQVSRLLGEVFAGLTLKGIRDSIVKALSARMDEYDEVVIQAIKLGKKAFDIDIESDIYILGRSRMFGYPEFNDRESLQLVFSLFDDKAALFNTLISVMECEGIQIRIGNENQYDGLNQCSVIAGAYGTREYLLGSMGVIGPKRMNYPKIISEIDQSTQKLSQALAQFLGNG